MMKKILLLSLVSVLVVGCVGNETVYQVDDSRDDHYESSDVDHQKSNTETDYSATVGLSELVGFWRKPCGPLEGQSHFDIVTLSFSSAGQYTTDIENYLDRECAKPVPDAINPKAFGAFKLGSGVMLNDGIIATEIDIRMKGYEEVSFSPVEHDIVYISDGILYIGKGNFDSPLERPTQLDNKRVFYPVNN